LAYTSPLYPLWGGQTTLFSWATYLSKTYTRSVSQTEIKSLRHARRGAGEGLI